MADGPLSSVLRETRAHLGHPVALAVLGALSLVLGLSGPFSTYALLGIGPRIAYWAIVVCGTYAIGTLVNYALARVLEPGRRPAWQRVVVTGLANGICATAFLLVLNRLALGPQPYPPDSLPGLFAFVTTVALAVSAVHALAHHHRQLSPGAFAAPGLAAGTRAAPRPPALLARLSPDRRGALVSLRVQDHYVEVRTTAGTTLLLMRLSDAIAETAPEPGLQVHRSHWVALSPITAARRKGETALLTLEDGREVPVSRGKLPAVTAAGLLPAPGGAASVGKVAAGG